MKISIIGSGNMGAALGKVWAKAGHQVMFSYSRYEKKLTDLAQFNANTSKGTVAEAIAFSDVIMLTVQPFLLKEVLQNADSFKGKTIITCVSGLRPDFSGQTVGLPSDLKTSIAETIAQILPEAHVIEAFNTTFSGIIEDPFFKPKLPASIFYCGENSEAMKLTESLIEDAGFAPVSAGGLSAAKALETFATAWVQLAAVGGFFPNIALNVLR
jgi:8-hydroxy-5-deazaflavin:NADPH oxidoreductase